MGKNFFCLNQSAERKADITDSAMRREAGTGTRTGHL